ncbi:MAG: DUF6390 family protein [Mycobacteriales bacterium]|nr:MAG: hypothetical protein DLM56_08850 [Pseudonocardiales bacterium]
MTAPQRVTPGPILFVRYAYPPNRHGYCGPADNQSFFEYGASDVVDPGLRTLASQFAGAWPYLELIAGATGIPDPLDRRVVEAYWVGNGLLDSVGVQALGDSMEERFRRRTGRQFPALAQSVVAGGVPHHSYHVFCIYPWVGLLGADRHGEHALHVLDRCRIRWGKVQQVIGDEVVVESQPLTWDGRRLSLGPAGTETVVRSVDGVGMITELAPGDWVSMHWEWVCDRLDRRQLTALRQFTARHLSLVNDRLDQPGATIALG